MSFVSIKCLLHAARCSRILLHRLGILLIELPKTIWTNYASPGKVLPYPWAMIAGRWVVSCLKVLTHLDRLSMIAGRWVVSLPKGPYIPRYDCRQMGYVPAYRSLHTEIWLQADGLCPCLKVLTHWDMIAFRWVMSLPTGPYTLRYDCIQMGYVPA